MGRQQITPTTLQCSECNRKLQIIRKKAKQREQGHVKHMHCPWCKMVVGFIEIKDFDFDEDGWMSLDGKVQI